MIMKKFEQKCGFDFSLNFGFVYLYDDGQTI